MTRFLSAITLLHLVGTGWHWNRPPAADGQFVTGVRKYSIAFSAWRRLREWRHHMCQCTLYILYTVGATHGRSCVRALTDILMSLFCLFFYHIKGLIQQLFSFLINRLVVWALKYQKIVEKYSQKDVLKFVILSTTQRYLLYQKIFTSQKLQSENFLKN